MSIPPQWLSHVLVRPLGMRLALVALLFLPASVIPVATAQAAPGDYTVARYEARVHTAVDAERVSRGRTRLSLGGCVDRYATRWSARLAHAGLLVHSSMTGMLRGCRSTRVAENLAYGAMTPEQVVAMWMVSPAHRANVLDGRLTTVGVAATYRQGQWSVVLDLARP